jgi:predicted enzyme related to lactoylglutathione lyase
VNLNQVTLPSIDVEQSVEFYRGMGFRLIVSALPRYARFECPVGEATFSVHMVESPSPLPTNGAIVYFECADLDTKVDELRGRGYVFSQLPTDQPWLWREARLRDPSNNELCLYSAGGNRRHPPWRVQR